MANEHVISIEREAKLSIDTSRLKISFVSTGENHYIAVIDIAALILAHPCISLSASVFKELCAVGAIIIHTSDTFMPIGYTLATCINLDGAKRPHMQAKYINLQEEKFWWAQIITSKILGQAKVLSLFDQTTANRLKTNATYIKPADEENIEAVCAKIYWDAYFRVIPSFATKREKQGASDIVNISLNYSYAIVRAIVARSLASAGLCLNFGVGHYRKDNPFNLVEDFIEPFRFIADKNVLEIFKTAEYEIFNSKLKKELLSRILSSIIKINNKEYRLFHGIDFAVNSFCASLEDPRRRLLLPNMPIPSGKKPVLKENNHIIYES